MIQFTGACSTNVVTPSQMLRFVRTPMLNEDGSACPSSDITQDLMSPELLVAHQHEMSPCFGDDMKRKARIHQPMKIGE
jgi:hypothetical protein